MKICRYQDSSDGTIRVGIVEQSGVYDVSAIVGELPGVNWPLPPEDLFIANLDRLRPRLAKLARGSEPLPVGDIILKSPVANPGKFICGAGNYPEVLAAGSHPRKLGLLFKTTSAMAGAGDGVTLRWPERETFHEMELAIIIGRQGTEISAADALDYVAGYAIGLDMTMQGQEMPSFGKCFDSYGVIGPWMVTADEIPDPSRLSFVLKVNGEVRQEDSIGRMVLDVPALIEHAASVMTLYPGDVIFSGTPPGSIGPVKPGDLMHAQMDGIGEMTVAVRGGPGRKTPID